MRVLMTLVLLTACSGDEEQTTSNTNCTDNVGGIYYPDADGDGYGVEEGAITSCTAPSGYVTDNRDCDDADADIHPGALEHCDGVDHDCDGLTLESDSIDAITLYLDGDGDGYGDDDISTIDCEQLSGYTDKPGDCDDANASLTPEDADGDGTSSCDGDCYDSDPTANGCPLTGTLDIATAAASTWTGEEGDALGYAYTPNSGDLNGDGIPDLILGAPGIPWNFGLTSGKVAIMYGPVNTGNLDADTDADSLITGVATNDMAGHAVATVDLDHDGDMDLVIGAPAANDATTGGSVYVIYGDGGDLASSIDLSAADLTVTGVEASSWFGYALSSSGDLNNDGFDDLVIGAPGNLMGGGTSSEGAAWVLLGGTKPVGVVSVATLSSAVITGSQPGENLGNSVAIIDDQDSDGVDELLLGAPSNHWWAKKLVEAGQAWLFLGPPSTSISTLADARFSSADSGDFVGVFVTDGGDLDGDGTSDLVIGASGDNDGGSSAGKLGVFFGPITSGDFDIEDADLTIAGTSSFIYIGERISSGYFDADSELDLLVSSWGEGGNLFYGPLSAGDILTSAADLSLNPKSSTTAVAAGASSSFVGDLDSDGFDDLVITDPSDTAGGADAGAAYLVSGQID